MGRAILGHVVGGPVAAGIGLGVGIISQPEVAIRLVGALERLGSRLEGRLADSASAVTGAVTGARRASSVSQREALRLWREQRRELDAMTPELMASRVGDLTAQFGPEADEVRPALTRAAVRSLEIRMAITPRATARAGSLTPHLGQLPPSDDELDRFVRLSRVLDDPASLMEGVVDGSIQADEVELLKAAYPATYAAIVGAVMERLTVLEREPSYEHRLALSVLLGVPTDPTLDPLFMQAVQSGFQVSQQPDQMTRPQRPLRADTRPVATEMQELTDGNT